MFDPYRAVGPVLRSLSPETAHRATIAALRTRLVRRAAAGDDAILACRVWGLDFANPIGLAAGFDKDAEVSDAMLVLGFGLVEAGTVTPLPQPGNPRPRLFRLDADRAVINRLGFNCKGLAAFAGRLARRDRVRGPVGANVGRNKETPDPVADFEIGVAAVAPLADYVVVNISSPNTPGLRTLQKRTVFAEFIARALAARDRATLDRATRPPLLVKISPDLDAEERHDIAVLALEHGVDGLIVGNSTVARPAGLASPEAREDGGLSGQPLFPLALACLEDFHRLTEGRLALVGCGGVASGDDAYRMIRAGASLVQLYSALVYDGPALVGRIKRDLAARLRADGFTSVGEAVGAAQDGGRANST